MTRNLFSIAIAALITIAMTGDGLAEPICLVDADIIDTTYVPPNSANPGKSGIEAYLDGADDPYPTADVGTELYKWNQGGSEEKPLEDSYDVVDLIDSGKDGGTIRYTPPGDIVDTSMPAFLVVKGGATGFVMYDLGTTGVFGVNWDGVMDLKFTNAGLLKNGNLQDVSNVQIWGSSKTPPDNVVPEPTALAIWSLVGLCGVGAARRSRQKKS